MSEQSNPIGAICATGNLLNQPGLLEDDALLTLVQQGDEQAMVTLFDRHSKLVYAIALRVLRDPAAAEDILQEIFMQVWRAPSRYLSARGSFPGWLAVVSRNRSIDALRQRRPSDSIDDLVLASPSNVASECEQHLMIERAHALMHQLPLGQQKLLEMAFFDGLTHSEIAETTGMALGTIKTHIRKALLTMRKAAQA